MNHIYKTVFNASLGIWIAVSELAKGKHKTSNVKQEYNSFSYCTKIAKAILLPPLFAFSSSVYALPTGNELIAGQATVATPTSSQMQINQASDRAVINWQGFSVGQNEAVHIQQPHANAALLNRVVGQDASQIQGKIQANGQVYLVNPNGVLFGKTAQVDVGGLVASTHDIQNDDFMAGRNHFSQSRQGAKVENHGAINTTDGGVVALIGEQVNNTGTINTPKGTTALVAGKTVDLDFKGDGLVEVKVTEAALNAQIENHGAITANGGRVLLSAKSANALMDTVLNQNGIVKAQGLIERNGEIILDGGDNGAVKISGTLDTTPVRPELVEGQSGQPANIQIKGNTIELSNTATVNASGNTKGGNIQIGDKQTTQTVTLKQDSTVQANAENGDAGHINVLAKMDTGKVDVQGKIHAKATSKGNGGFIDTSAHQVNISDTATINTQGKDGKNGTWLIDPFDFKIAATGGNITGDALSIALKTNSVTIQTLDTGTSCTNATCTAGSSGNGDIFVNDVVGNAINQWTANTLTLNAWRNIYINADINGSGAAKLALEYGQGSSDGVIAGNTSDYFINNASQVNLPKGNSFSTKLGTSGTTNTYTVITELGAENSMTGADLQGMNGNLSGLYALGANIDATSTKNWNAGAGFLPVGSCPYSWCGGGTAFTSQFAGLGHIITGLTIDRPAILNVGLFGYTDGSIIRDIGMVGGTITGGGNVGGLVGCSNCDNPSNLVINIINHSYATGNVNGGDLVGGLVGANQYGGNINNSYARGNVNGGYEVGGLVGWNRGSINNSYATGNVNGTLEDVGGLVGWNGISGNINNSYATGNVNVGGGLVALNEGNISNSYAIGNVNNGGGLVYTNVGNLSNSFWNIQTTGHTNGFVNNGTSTTIQGKTTAELQQLSTFSNAGWDIANTGSSNAVWRIYDGHTYPLLRSFLSPLTVAANNISKTYNGLSNSTPSYTNTVTGATVIPNNNLFGIETSYGNAKNVGIYTFSGAGLYSN